MIGMTKTNKTNRTNIQELKEQSRKQLILEKAQEIAKTGKIIKIDRTHWKVFSSDPRYPGLAYDCEFSEEFGILICSCPHFTNRGEYCKHLVAIALAEKV